MPLFERIKRIWSEFQNRREDIRNRRRNTQSMEREYERILEEERQRALREGETVSEAVAESRAYKRLSEETGENRRQEYLDFVARQRKKNLEKLFRKPGFERTPSYSERTGGPMVGRIEARKPLTREQKKVVEGYARILEVNGLLENYLRDLVENKRGIRIEKHGSSFFLVYRNQMGRIDRKELTGYQQGDRLYLGLRALFRESNGKHVYLHDLAKAYEMKGR